MTTTTVQENLKAFFLENPSELRQVVSELHSWNGSLEYLQAHENDDDFFETFFAGKTVEAVRATQFGEYRYSDDLVRFNGYANLDSFSERDYEEELADSLDDIISVLMDEHHNLNLDSEIEEILEGNDEDENEE